MIMMINHGGDVFQPCFNEKRKKLHNLQISKQKTA